MKERTSPRPSRALPPLRSQRLLDQVRERVRYLHYSIRTEQAYVHWVRAFVRFQACAIRAEMGARRGRGVSHLARRRAPGRGGHASAGAVRRCCSSTRRCSGSTCRGSPSIGRPQAPRRIARRAHRTARSPPCWRSIASADIGLLAELLYGTGMRLWKACACASRMSISSASAIVVREGKGGKDRVVMLPRALVPALRAQLRAARRLWQQDRDDGRAGVHMPDALAAQVPARRPIVDLVLGLSAERTLAVDPRSTASSERRRHHASTRASSAPSSARWRRAGIEQAGHRRTRCAIRSPRTCCRPATTSAPCRSCSATPT